MADCFALSHNDVILPIVPLFHANAWGFPHAAAITGAKFVFLGPNLDPETILDAIVEHGVTFAAGVPTIWLNVFARSKNIRIAGNLRRCARFAAAALRLSI